MEVKEAREIKDKLEKDMFDLLVEYETATGLDIVGVFVERVDISQIGEGKQSQLNRLEIVVGIDVPPTPREAM